MKETLEEMQCFRADEHPAGLRLKATLSLSFLFLLQVGTSFTGTPCRLVAWCTRVNSPQSNHPWTCMMRTKPDFFFKYGLLGVSPFEI